MKKSQLQMHGELVYTYVNKGIAASIEKGLTPEQIAANAFSFADEMIALAEQTISGAVDDTPPASEDVKEEETHTDTPEPGVGETAEVAPQPAADPAAASEAYAASEEQKTPATEEVTA